jgi:hypothetical protein
MREFLEPHVMISLAVIVCVLAMVAMTLIIVLRDKISGVLVSRTGVEIHTNDVSVWSKVVDTIEQIDTETCRSIRKATTGLLIIDPSKHGMSAESMLVIREANSPLVYAAYENHHTRALKSDADVYLADKTHDITEAVRIMKPHFSELTDERCNALACHWLKKILLPNLRRACNEKAAYYQSQLKQTAVSKTVKTILTECLTKNEEYIECIDLLAARQDIAEKSSIFCTAQTT